MRTPYSTISATLNIRKRGKRSHHQERRVSWDSSADTVVYNPTLASPEGKEQAALWEEDINEDTPEGCSSMVIDDDFATLVGSDDGYDLEKHEHDYCSSTFSVDDEPPGDEDGGSAESAPSSLREMLYTPTLSPFGGIETSTKLPFWSRLFKLILPFWSSL